MNPPHILIVDDEESIRFILERSLRNEGYLLDTAANGNEAILKLQSQTYNLILLDLQMEPIGGIEVFNVARKKDKDVIVIILTAHGSLDSSVNALRLGAFDYLFKPANPSTIRSRVRDGLDAYRKGQQRRRLVTQIDSLHQLLNELNNDGVIDSESSVNNRFLHSGPLVIDTHHQVAAFNDEEVDLTTTGYNLLLCLVKSSPVALTPRELVNCGLGYDAEKTEAREIIKWHIHKLRRKIETDPSHPQYIRTVRYKGYLWSA